MHLHCGISGCIHPCIRIIEHQVANFESSVSLGTQEGATVKCGGKNCTQFVHPLCARNSGGYLTTRDVGGRIVHRAFCQVHAEAARRRDRTAQEVLLPFIGLRSREVGSLQKARPVCGL